GAGDIYKPMYNSKFEKISTFHSTPFFVSRARTVVLCNVYGFIVVTLFILFPYEKIDISHCFDDQYQNKKYHAVFNNIALCIREKVRVTLLVLVIKVKGVASQAVLNMSPHIVLLILYIIMQIKFT
ncbi:hypothetical protein ACJX0J_009906, partial [Zea mays]